MIQIRNLKITHNKDLKVILENFNLSLNRGDKAVIIGEEGNGKSTLLKWIYNPDLVSDYAECVGERITANEKLRYLPQEITEADKNKSVYEFLSESEMFYDMDPKELGFLTSQFHMSSDFIYSNQLMKTLSGGEKIKIQLFRLLIDSPSSLLLDEPSNDIDISTLEFLEELINNWNGIVLFVSHDEMLIERTANKVIHIEQIMRKTKSRYTVAKQSYKSYIEEKLNKFSHQEQQALSDRREKKKRDERYRKIEQSVTSALKNVSRQNPSEAKALKDKMHTVKSMGKRFENEDKKMTEMPEQEEAIYFTIGDEDSLIPMGKTVIEYKLDCLKSPDGERILSENINLSICGPKKICIIGDNGIGKTTLLKKIASELLKRTDIHVQYMPQNYEELLDMNITPVDFLNKSGDKDERTKIRTHLGSLKFTADEMEHSISELSGGQKAKIFLLKLSLSKVNVLILDEPTRNFSPLSAPVIRQMIKDFKGAVISISHDRKYIEEVSDEVYRLTSEGLILVK